MSAAADQNDAPCYALADLSDRDRNEAVELVAQAFVDNPLNQAVIGAPRERRLLCNRAGSQASLEVALGRVEVRGARCADGSGPLLAVLVAQPPDRRCLPMPSWRSQFRCLAAQGWRVAQRWNQANF